MIGAIIGDVVGSLFEFDQRGKQKYDFKLISKESDFTDDTVLTIAVMDWLLHSEKRDEASIAEYFRKWCYKYPCPKGAYGGRFSAWLCSKDPKPYGSTGNGAAMRISPVAYFAKTKEELLFLSDIVTNVTHNSKEGIKGARSIALATWMALNGFSKDEIRQMAESYYPEIKDFDFDDLVKHYYHQETCNKSCPQALYCFLISDGFEDCLRKTVCVGGDTDTTCAMSCAIAEAFYKDIPEQLGKDVWEKLPKDIQHVIGEFNQYLRIQEDNESLVFELHYDLDRFVKAQSYSYETAKKELLNGRKESHWMWYIFPQIRGLGHSSMSYEYGLGGIGEARAYFGHQLLRNRLIELCIILTNLKTNDASEVFGDLDAMKLKSSMTLFYIATRGEIFFKNVLDKFFNGELDQRTVEIIEQQKKDVSGE